MKGKVYNIADRLNGGKPCIRLDDNTELKVNNTLPAVLMISAIQKKKDKDGLEGLIETAKIALGAEVVEELMQRDYTLQDWQTILKAIMAAISEQELEEIEAEMDAETEKND